MASLPPPQSKDSIESEAAVCHILPCHVEYTGALDGRQFEPSMVQTDDNKTTTTVEAVTLRGRGLLAQAPALEIPSAVASGHVFQVLEKSQVVPTTTSTTNDQVSTEATISLKHLPSLQFDSVQEWHHEHIPTAVSIQPSRLKDALEICQVANALHAPLPVTKSGEKANSKRLNK